MKRIRSFDLIRILATFFITVFHWNVYCSQLMIDTKNIFFLFFASGNIAYIGVSLFFILSGASLMYTYRSRLKPGEYFKKRFLSIYPQYWVSYIAIFIYMYAVRKNPMTLPKNSLILSFLGMDGFLYYKVPCYYLIGEWFVGCIVFIYLLFPLLRCCIIRWPRATAAVTVLLYIPFVYFYPFEMDISHFPLMRVPEVMLGMYYAQYCCGPDRTEQGEKTAAIPAPAGLAALALFAVVYFVEIDLPTPYLNIWIGGSAFFALCWIFQYLERFDGWPMRALSQLSAYTYSFFLIHHILMANFLLRYQGGKLSSLHNYALFAYYVFCIGMISILLYYIAALIIRPIKKAGG